MSVMAAPPAAPQSGNLEITVIDRANVPLEGVTVTFWVGRVLLGTVVTGTHGASIVLPNSITEIEAVAKYGDTEERKRILTKDDFSHAFVFERQTHFAFAAPVAKCPNGDTGQPCVDCVVAGKSIRICA